MAVQGVWEDNWRFLASNADNFALMGMELHHPSVFPLFEPTQVALSLLIIRVVSHCHVDHGIVRK